MTNKGARAAVKPAIATDGPVFDRTVNIDPVKVELVTDIKESSNAKLLGAVLLFPKVKGREEKRYWISFDHLLTSSKDLFNKFYDNASLTFVNACKVGVKDGHVFLAAA